MAYEIRIERQAGHPLAVVRRRAKMNELTKVVPDACGVAWDLIRKNNLPNPGRLVAIYYDKQINLEVGAEIGAPLPARIGDLFPASTPAGLVATTVHFGPYQKL